MKSYDFLSTYNFFVHQLLKLVFETLDKYVEEFAYPKLTAINDFKQKIQKIAYDDPEITFREYNKALTELKISVKLKDEHLKMYFEGLYEIQEILDNWFLKTKGEK